MAALVKQLPLHFLFIRKNSINPDILLNVKSRAFARALPDAIQ
jgi:hypothetical protein